MDTLAFWGLIDASREESEGEIDRQIEALTSKLAELPPEEIVAFDELFREHLSTANRWDLWAAAYIINGGCSDDGFEYFRAWLIGQGERVYNEALADPETLADRAEPDAEGEGLIYAAAEAYESSAGADLPVTATAQHGPTGEEWSEDDLERMYPKLWERFG